MEQFVGVPKTRPPPMAASTASVYESAPLLLNLERDPSTGKFTKLASTWCNLGLWPPDSPSCSFRQACAALTVALGEAANVGYGDSVLDVGVGYGDQTAVWIERFGASRVVAVEVSATHIAAARKAQDAGLLPAAVELRQASAANTRQVIASDGQQFDGVGRQFDVVLCLDCAYHFRPSRKNFLLLAASLALKPGGRYAAVDLIMSRADEDLADDPNATAGWLWWRKTLRACLRRAIALAVDIPSTNLHGVKAYEESLEAGGFEAAKFEVLTDRVLLPFARHAARQRKLLSAELTYGQAAFLLVLEWLFSFVAWSGLFDVVMVTATRL